jgi:glycosyltransferase involved in cell wall biosynthesis
MMNKIIFLSVHPIHYNDFLFSEIKKSGVDIEVYYANKSLKNYPWKSTMNYAFTAQECSYVLKVDWNLLAKAITSRNTLFIVAGWDSLFKNLLLLTLLVCGKKYIIWTDTVKMNLQRKAIKAKLRNAWLKTVLGGAYRIFTTGEIGVREMKRLYSEDETKIVNFPFATDLSYFSGKTSYDNYDREHVVFSSGRLLNFHKGHDLAIKAMGTLKKKGYKFVYNIAGTGPDEAMLRQLILEQDLEREVNLLGWQELSDLKYQYGASHILLHPSHFDPFPNAILEAMATGLVVLSSDKAGSAVERIKHGISGFIFPDNDLDALIKNLEHIFTLEQHEMESISQGAKSVANRWNVQYNIAQVQEALKA